MVLLPVTCSSAVVGEASPAVAVGVAPGVNVMVQLAPAARVAPQVLDVMVVPAGRPVVLTARSTAGSAPELVTVTFRGLPGTGVATAASARELKLALRVVADADADAGAGAGALGEEPPPQADTRAVATNNDDNRRGE